MAFRVMADSFRNLLTEATDDGAINFCLLGKGTITLRPCPLLALVSIPCGLILLF